MALDGGAGPSVEKEEEGDQMALMDDLDIANLPEDPFLAIDVICNKFLKSMGTGNTFERIITSVEDESRVFREHLEAYALLEAF